MEYWPPKVTNLGEVKVGKKQVVKFYGTADIPEIERVSSSCSCSNPKYDAATRTLTVGYTPHAVPFHQRSQGWY